MERTGWSDPRRCSRRRLKQEFLGRLRWKLGVASKHLELFARRGRHGDQDGQAEQDTLHSTFGDVNR